MAFPEDHVQHSISHDGEEEGDRFVWRLPIYQPPTRQPLLPPNHAKNLSFWRRCVRSSFAHLAFADLVEGLAVDAQRRRGTGLQAAQTDLHAAVVAIAVLTLV